MRARLDTGYAGDRRAVTPRFIQQAGCSGREGIEPSSYGRAGYRPLSIPVELHSPWIAADLLLAPLISVSIHAAASPERV